MGRFAPLAAGKWRVAFAPHITKLSALALARFDPIYYVLDGRPGLRARVRIRAWLSVKHPKPKPYPDPNPNATPNQGRHRV